MIKQIVNGGRTAAAMPYLGLAILAIILAKDAKIAALKIVESPRIQQKRYQKLAGMLLGTGYWLHQFGDDYGKIAAQILGRRPDA